MKKIMTIAFTLTLILILSACGGEIPAEEPVEVVESATEAIQEPTKDNEIPYETANQIEKDIEQEIFKLGALTDNMTLYVMDGSDSGSVSILISWSGMPLEVQFPDYVNASIIQINDVVKKYGFVVSDIDVGFTRGTGESVTWHSTDGVSGTLFDSYGSDAVSAVSYENQTIQDLVARYGCTNEFYNLSEYEAVE